MRYLSSYCRRRWSCVSPPPNSRECREQALCSFRTSCVERADWVAPYGGEKRDNARAYARASAVFLFFAFTSSPLGANPLIYSRMCVKVSPSCSSPRIGSNALSNSEIRVKASPQKPLRRSVPKIITGPAVTERTKKVKASRLNLYVQTTYAKSPQEVKTFSLARTLRARPAFFVFCLHFFTSTAEPTDIQNNKSEGN